MATTMKLTKQEILKRANEHFANDCHYLGDVSARRELSERMINAARPEEPLTYTKLVRGVWFQLPDFNDGKPFQLDWRDPSHRDIIAQYLGEISLRTYEAGGFLLSAIVVKQKDGRASSEPAPGFFALMDLLELPHPDKLAAVYGEMKKASAWLQSRPGWKLL